jgi:hypothetical protein
VDFVWDSTQGKWISGTKSISGSYNEESKSWKFNYYEGTARKASWDGFDSIQSVSSKQYRFYSKEFDTQKVYIYTLCEHLAELFAKLSNIRMSHEIYGFKHPHCQWEGILALDIFYNLLYKEIDAKYPFNERYFEMNPMQRRTLCKADNINYVVMDDGRNLFLQSDHTCEWEGMDTKDENLEWMEDETSDEFVYIWDSTLWAEYYNNSQKIADTRKECTTPRGVLAKVYHIVKGLEYKWESYFNQRDGEEQDYKWFEQKGKIYTHWDDKSLFTKYVNLHLGMAYDVMTGKEYCELAEIEGNEDSTTGEITYVKPKFSELPLNSEDPDELTRKKVLDRMMERGFKTLIDAFSVVQNEHLFNIYGVEDEMDVILCETSTNVIEDASDEIVCAGTTSREGIEEFKSDRLNCYSESQCAIVLERVFSRIYKYLQFKSTTSETFQRHINIDSGYKYLTTDSLKNSDHDLGIYYDLKKDSEENVEKHYLRYLNKLNEYVNSTSSDSGIGLTASEKAILKEFCNILSKQTLDWLDEKWDSCPLLTRASEKPDSLSPRKLMMSSRGVEGSGESIETLSGGTYQLNIDFSKNALLKSDWKASDEVECPSNWEYSWNGDVLTVAMEASSIVDLSNISLKSNPVYEYDSSIMPKYGISGYKDSPSSSRIQFSPDKDITISDFGGQSSKTIYVSWVPVEYVMVF